METWVRLHEQLWGSWISFWERWRDSSWGGIVFWEGVSAAADFGVSVAA